MSKFGILSTAILVVKRNGDERPAVHRQQLLLNASIDFSRQISARRTYVSFDPFWVLRALLLLTKLESLPREGSWPEPHVIGSTGTML